MIINTKRDGLKKTKVYDTYWQFACERQNIFMRKLMGGKCNLTNDMILREYKFTNAYRASDRVSQYLIRNVIYQSICISKSGAASDEQKCKKDTKSCNNRKNVKSS